MRTSLVALLVSAGACADQNKSKAAPYLVSTSRDGEQIRVEVKTGGGHHLNDEYPVSFEAEDAGRLQLKDAMKKTPCASEPAHSCTGVVNVPNATGVFAFSVCTAEKCLIEKVPFTAVR